MWLVWSYFKLHYRELSISILFSPWSSWIAMQSCSIVNKWIYNPYKWFLNHVMNVYWMCILVYYLLLSSDANAWMLISVIRLWNARLSKFNWNFYRKRFAIARMHSIQVWSDVSFLISYSSTCIVQTWTFGSLYNLWSNTIVPFAVFCESPMSKGSDWYTVILRGLHDLIS